MRKRRAWLTVIVALAALSPLGTAMAQTCSAAYPDFCIPDPPPDLDCKSPEIAGRVNFTALPPDPHRLDGTDGDQVACDDATQPRYGAGSAQVTTTAPQATTSSGAQATTTSAAPTTTTTARGGPSATTTTVAGGVAAMPSTGTDIDSQRWATGAGALVSTGLAFLIFGRMRPKNVWMR